MLNFRYQNPVEIIFGKGQIATLSSLVPEMGPIMITYGGGSIKKNGVLKQVKKALKGRSYIEFHGIEPNPSYETLMKAVNIVKHEKVKFLLAVGGGSVLDGTKFIAAAACFKGKDPWDICSKSANVLKALPLGCVMTLPATGSEMNAFAVISRHETEEKLAFYSPLVFPKFAILDPETSFSLPLRQVANGIVDTFVHVCEQYITYPVNSPVQDRQAEGILLTLKEEAPKVLSEPDNYDTRANLVWAATQALNGWISCGVPQDWLTHNIGHEITAITGTDHARTLALVLPAVWNFLRKEKADKILQYAHRVWGITGKNPDRVIDRAILRTKEFFREIGIQASRDEYGVTDDVCKKIAHIVDARGEKWGEHANIGGKEILEILALCD